MKGEQGLDGLPGPQGENYEVNLKVSPMFFSDF